MPQRPRFERAGVSLLLLATVRCAFPDYDVVPPTTGGTNVGAEAGAGANAPAGSGGGGKSGGGGSAQGGATDLPGGAPGSAGEAVGGAECAPEQWPVQHCGGGCLHQNPGHCYDGEQSGDEVSVDCGGSCQACSNEVCTGPGDCISGQCVADATESNCFAPLSVQYTAHEQNRSVSSTAWSLKLINDEPVGGKSFGFRDLKLRYYFERSGLVEPLIVRATQSNLRLANGQVQGIPGTTWNIERTEPAADVLYDAYVEVGFDESGKLYPGDSVDLYQQMLTGDTSSSNFDQGANYSFAAATGTVFLHVVVLYQDRVIWGLEPRPANPRQCFVRGVNFNGPAVTISGNAWQSSMDAKVAPGGGSGVSQGSALFPPVTGGLSTMMQTAFKLGAGAELSLPVDNGGYLMYLYAVSPGANDSMPSAFTVQGEEQLVTSKFRSQATDGGQAWARLGPFRVDVKDATLRVGVSAGSVSFAGLELWYPD